MYLHEQFIVVVNVDKIYHTLILCYTNMIATSKWFGSWTHNIYLQICLPLGRCLVSTYVLPNWNSNNNNNNNTNKKINVKGKTYLLSIDGHFGHPGITGGLVHTSHHRRGHPSNPSNSHRWHHWSLDYAEVAGGGWLGPAMRLVELGRKTQIIGSMYIEYNYINILIYICHTWILWLIYLHGYMIQVNYSYANYACTHKKHWYYGWTWLECLHLKRTPTKPTLKVLGCPLQGPLQDQLFLSTATKNQHVSGQFITTSAEVTPNGGLVRESPPKWP